MSTPTRRRRHGTVNGTSVLLLFTGVLLVFSAMRGLLWYSIGGGNNIAGNGFTYDDLHRNARSLGAAVTGAYFDWIAVTMLVAVTVLGIGANVPSPAAPVLRLLGFVAGAVGLIATYYAVAQLFNAQRAAGGSSHSIWHNSSFGLWAALGGFALATLGAALGVRRAPDTIAP